MTDGIAVVAVVVAAVVVGCVDLVVEIMLYSLLPSHLHLRVPYQSPLDQNNFQEKPHQSQF